MAEVAEAPRKSDLGNAALRQSTVQKIVAGSVKPSLPNNLPGSAMRSQCLHVHHRFRKLQHDLAEALHRPRKGNVHEPQAAADGMLRIYPSGALAQIRSGWGIQGASEMLCLPNC